MRDGMSDVAVLTDQVQPVLQGALAKTSRKYSISEIFGPTRQGEGPQAGLHTFFVRFAGCDWSCSWCDTKYAINPTYKGWKQTWMTVDEIMARLTQLGALPGDWITLSGGNPALFVDLPFCDQMHESGFWLSMETQGSRTFAAKNEIDCLVVSPKPPSSGMQDRFDPGVVAELVDGRSGVMTAIKLVAFDAADMEWAVVAKAAIERLLMYRGQLRWYLSAGTPLVLPIMPPGVDAVDAARLTVCHALADLWMYALNDPQKRFREFYILPQTHVLVVGQKDGF